MKIICIEWQNIFTLPTGVFDYARFVWGREDSSQRVAKMYVSYATEDLKNKIIVKYFSLTIQLSIFKEKLK